MGIKVIVSDFDGTLVDTAPSIIATMEETLDALRLPPLDRHEVRTLIGQPLEASFERAGLAGETLNEAIKDYRARYDRIALRTASLFPGVREALETLEQEGVAWAVASNKGRDSLRALLHSLGVDGHIQHVIGAQDVVKKKPASDAIRLVQEKTGAPAEEILVVGDTTIDVEFGKNAGCVPCAVTYGYGERVDLEKAQPTYLIDDFRELIGIVRRTSTKAQ